MFLWLYICPLHLHVIFDTSKSSSDQVEKVGTVILPETLIWNGSSPLWLSVLQV